MIHGINGTTLDGVTITSGSTCSIDAGNTNYLDGNLINIGTFLLGGSRFYRSIEDRSLHEIPHFC
jgi:hypothetical protein